MEVDKVTTTKGTDRPTLTDVVKETAAIPVRALLSKTALRTYLSSILILFTAFTLYAIAVVAYVYFYYNYIPNLRFSAPIHLQFDHTPHDVYTNQPSYHPNGISSLASSIGVSSVLVSQQKYDLSLQLSMPKTPTNVAAGNFMVSVSLLGPSSQNVMPPYSPASPLNSLRPNATVLAQSSRPTSLTYRSPAVEYAKKALRLPWYVFNWKQETEVLTVNMMDGVTFDRGWRNIPTSVWVEVRSRERLHIYACEVHIKATLRGVRYLMYQHRILSFMALTSMFWIVEMSTTLFIWLAVSFALSAASKPPQDQAVSKPDDHPVRRVKQERYNEDDDADNLSDTERTFPTYTGQPPLRYTSPERPQIKEEYDDGPSRVKAEGAEADISATDASDEDADFVPEQLDLRSRDHDSGLGTSMESSSGSVVRRRSRGGK